MEQSKRRRKKNVYVEYDYEEAYQKQIENLEEDIIKRMMDGKKIKYVYATKEIKAGEQLEKWNHCLMFWHPQLVP